MSNPKLIPVPFADGGTYTNISTNRGSGDALEQPNYSEGFPTITSTPLAAGGKAPRREDFNGLLHDLSANISHLNKGGFFTFDADFATKIGGYPKGAVLQSDDGTKKYISLVDGNTSNFNTAVDPTKWVRSALTERETQDIAWGVGKTSSPWAPLISPALTGTPTAPTAAAGTNTTQIATTAFVNAEIVADRPFEATAANIKMDGTQAVGTLNTVARGDHVHPTDTSRAPLASPSFTGTPTAPTAAVGTNTTQIATMAAVQGEFAARTYTSAELSFSYGAQILVTHTLGVVSVVSLYAKCIAATEGYSVGDIVALNPSPCIDSHNNIPLGVQSVIANNSVLLLFCASVPLRHKVNGTWVGCNPANWRVIVDLVK